MPKSAAPERAAPQHSKPVAVPDLRPLLDPRAVAIIGASTDPSRIGGRPLRYMLEAGFDRPIYPINPNRETVQGLKAYPSIDQAPGPVDCAIIAVPAALVPDALEACAAQGVKSAVVFSAGFAEAGDRVVGGAPGAVAPPACPGGDGFRRPDDGRHRRHPAWRREAPFDPDGGHQARAARAEARRHDIVGGALWQPLIQP